MILETEVTENMESAKSICSEDIIAYGLIWKDVQALEGSELMELKQLVDSIPAMG